MGEITVSNCENNFLLKAILQGKRLDGRKDNDYRNLKIIFGNFFGCCVVSLGETRVMAQTSYEIQTPKSTRLNEGLLHINVDLGAMAAQHIESGWPTETAVQLNRLLEKCLKESKCVDLESLCIVAEEKVWAVRVDVTILNHDGGLIDCASLAALASLAHSRRQDFTLSGKEITFHSFAERDPLPLTLHHHPICVSYAIFDNGSKAVVNPTLAEEEVAETHLVVGMNAFRELCGLHLDGAGLPGDEGNDIVLQCVSMAAVRAVEVINTLKQTLAEDEAKRVMAQTSYEIQTPKSTRLNEGLLHINVDLSAMAAQHIESGRPTETAVQLNRLLEKCLKESKCVDLESLCIVAEEKVWAVRVDVTILNHDGGLIDCASLAALASLAHSRRQDFTLSGEEITFHSFAERDPLPLTLHHHPICVSYAIFDNGSKAVINPTLAEEEVAETHLVVGMNAFRELCGLHLDGAGLRSNEGNDIVLQCVSRAVGRAVEVINTLKQTLAEDEAKRQEKAKTGFSECVRLNKVSSLAEERIPVRLDSKALQEKVRKLMKHKFKNTRKTWDEDGNEMIHDEDSDGEEVADLGNHTAELVDQRNRKPKVIHLNLGKMDQDSIASTSEENDTEAEDSDSVKNEPLDENAKNGEPIQMEVSDSDEDIEEVHAVENVEGKTGKKSEQQAAKPERKEKEKDKREDEQSDDSEVEVVQELTYEEKMRLAEKIVLDDSEEEETVVLHGGEQKEKPEKSRQPQEKAEDPKKKKGKKKQNKKARTWYPQGQW